MKILLTTILLAACVTGAGQKQYVKFDYAVIDGDSTTTKIFTYQYPVTSAEFSEVMRDLKIGIKFSNPFDKKEFWLYVLLYNEINNYSGYKEGFYKIIEQMNWWLSDRYNDITNDLKIIDNENN